MNSREEEGARREVSTFIPVLCPNLVCSCLQSPVVCLEPLKTSVCVWGGGRAWSHSCMRVHAHTQTNDTVYQADTWSPLCCCAQDLLVLLCESSYEVGEAGLMSQRRSSAWYRDQRRACKTWLSPSTACNPAVEHLRFSDLSASALTFWASFWPTVFTPGCDHSYVTFFTVWIFLEFETYTYN